MREFAADGLSSVIMSIDSSEVAKHEKNRGLPDVCRKIQRANELFTELGVPTTASVTASKLLDDYAKLPDFLRTLGFSNCTFSYPLTSLPSSYLSFSDSELVAYSDQELIGVFEKIKLLKARSDFPCPQSGGIAQRYAAPPAQGAGKIRLPRGPQIFFSRLEPQSVPLPRLGHAHVQHLRIRFVEADPRRLHQVHD
jgi:hypothetical protein